MRLIHSIGWIEHFLFGFRRHESSGAPQETQRSDPIKQTKLEEMLLADLEWADRGKVTQQRECAPHPADQDDRR